VNNDVDGLEIVLGGYIVVEMEISDRGGEG
jgi:hypothetical protein